MLTQRRVVVLKVIFTVSFLGRAAVKTENVTQNPDLSCFDLDDVPNRD